MKKNMKFEILKKLFECYQEIIVVKYDYYYFRQELIINFGKNERMVNLLDKEIKEYLDAVYREIKVIKFMLKNEKKLYINDIYKIFDILDENFNNRYMYKEALFNNLGTAIGMKLDYKFYAPLNKTRYTTDKDVEKYINYVKGFNEENVKLFLLDNEIITEEEYKKELKKAKILNIEINDDNEELFGIFDNAFVLPKVKDEKTTLIFIHEFIHKVLQKEEDIKSTEDLPIFYELLFKKDNKFATSSIHETELSLELIDDYNLESFKEQIEKYRKIRKRQ